MAITDRESAIAWLKDKPREVQVAFAARCALRALPGIATADRATLGDIAPPVVRATLTSGVAAVGLTTEVEKAASASVEKTADYLTTVTERDSVYAAYEAAYFAAAALTDSASANIASASSANSAASAAYFAAYFDSAADINPAYSAAYTAAWSAADADATRLDSDTPEFLFRQPLWSGAPMPEELQEAYDTLKAFWAEDSATWGFWARWYERMVTGNPLPWDLQSDVALIPDDVWEAGPQAVADRIREIEGESEAEPLDQDALRSHLETLIDATDLHADAAKSAENLIVEAIERFKREADANILPDGFGQFENLPPTFANIARILGSAGTRDQKVADLQDEISRLYAIIVQLRSDLNDANLRLQTLRPDAFEAARTRTFGEKLQTTLTNVTLIGAVGMAALNFFGVSAEDLNYDSLKGALQSLSEAMRGVQADSPPEKLPPTTEV